MKNNSLQYPFPTLNDSFFDKNKDGKLNTIETAFRDAHLNEMKHKANQTETKNQSKNIYNKTKSSQNDLSGKTLAIISMVFTLIIILFKFIIN